MKTFTVGEYQFDVPWSDMEERKMRVTPGHLELTSQAGFSLVILTGKPRELVSALSSTDPKLGPLTQYVREGNLLDSDYDFTKYMLETTTQRVHRNPFRRENTVRGVFLLMKQYQLLGPAETGLFSIETNGFRGFQYGDPRRQPQAVVVTLFSGETKVQFSFFRLEGAPLRVSQAEINTVVRSFRKKPN